MIVPWEVFILFVLLLLFTSKFSNLFPHGLSTPAQ
jgi:hypothetical protein